MNLLKFWKSFFLPIQLGFGGGGGGGNPAPMTSTTQTSNIPEYARPYVETMLGATQQQVFNTQPQAAQYDENGNQTNSGAVDITGIKPYVPYSQNPADYVAPFSPLQQQAQQGTANLQTPEQYNTGTQMAGIGGLGTMNTAGQMANAGNQYQRQATSMYGPGGIGDYMNPYIAQSLAPQLNLLAQQYGLKGAQEQGAATSAGAFGGSRNALMQGLNQQNQLLAQQSAIGQGYNTAYQQAQQAQQFRANLGLQGQQAAQAGYGQLANIGNTLAGIGGQQLGAQQGILSAQNQMGNQQQQQQQNIINQAIQNYATAQQYPQQQLAFLNAQIRGLPLQTMTTQGYQAAPSSISQLAGLGLTGAAAYGLAKKKGGVIKESDGLDDLGLYNAMNKAG